MAKRFRGGSIGLALLLAWAGAAAQAVELLDEPTGLAWSAREVEAASGDTLAPLLARAARDGKLGCQRRCDQIDRVFPRLVAQARLQSARAHALDWSLAIVRLDDEAALTLPAGRIVLSESLIEAHDLSDEALAFVLAHEMAHSLLEHERQALTFARMLLASPVVERSVSDMYVEMAFNHPLVQAMEPVLHQGEYEADELGLLLAALAGFAPNRQIEFMEGEVVDAANPGAATRTHPAPADRLERLLVRLPLAWRLYRLP